MGRADAALKAKKMLGDAVTWSGAQNGADECGVVGGVELSRGRELEIFVCGL